MFIDSIKKVYKGSEEESGGAGSAILILIIIIIIVRRHLEISLKTLGYFTIGGK